MLDRLTMSENPGSADKGFVVVYRVAVRLPGVLHMLYLRSLNLGSRATECEDRRKPRDISATMVSYGE